MKITITNVKSVARRDGKGNYAIVTSGEGDNAVEYLCFDTKIMQHKGESLDMDVVRREGQTSIINFPKVSGSGGSSWGGKTQPQARAGGAPPSYMLAAYAKDILVAHMNHDPTLASPDRLSDARSCFATWFNFIRATCDGKIKEEDDVI